ncbi:MAG: phosphoribosyl-ATP diphosphatase [bacterium]
MAPDSGADADGRNRDVRPVVVQDTTGAVVTVAATNDKGHKKSIERGELWIVDEQTGRLLPHPGPIRVISVTTHAGWYLATTPGRDEGAGEGAGNAAGEGATPGAPGADTNAPDVTILADLWTTIQERNKTRPAGSYTTHLFTQGEEKIRKKTGEEAVELLLARSPDETVHEAADLIYHLLVLLAATGLGIDALLAELRRRT